MSRHQQAQRPSHSLDNLPFVGKACAATRPLPSQRWLHVRTEGIRELCRAFLWHHDGGSRAGIDLKCFPPPVVLTPNQNSKGEFFIGYLGVFEDNFISFHRNKMIFKKFYQRLKVKPMLTYKNIAVNPATCVCFSDLYLPSEHFKE